MFALAIALAACDDPAARTGDAGIEGRDAQIHDAGAPADAAIPPVDAALPPDAGPPPWAGPVLYPGDRRHSPIPLELGDAMRAIAARGARADDVLAKVGDSITVSSSFLHCFAGTRVDLDGRDALQATLDHFRAGDAAGTDPFRRESLAAGVGWTASRALMGDPSPLASELAVISPRFAVVMYGTNDAGFVDHDTYARNMTAITDALIAGGTIPVLSSIPPRDDSTTADARVPLFGGIVRALAASRGVPFVDYHRELLAIPGHGLASDGVHPQASSLGACVLTPAGLEAGANVRNLLTLEALDRARRVVLGGEDALDPDAPRLAGAGTRADPFVVASLPFAHAIDTRTDGESAIDRWDACSTADESGPEVRFRFVLDAPARITALVASGAGADLDLHVVAAEGGPESCIARDNRELTLDLAAGAYDLVADTFASTAGPLAGEGHVVLVLR